MIDIRKYIERPSEETQFKVFSNVFDAFKLIDLEWNKKYAGFERILWESKQVDHWVPKAITHDALAILAKNGFKKYNPQIVRGHIISRRNRAEKLFSNKFKTNKDAFDFFMEADMVTLITKTENSRSKSTEWSESYRFSQKLVHWRSSGYAMTYTDELLYTLKKIALKAGISF